MTIGLLGNDDYKNFSQKCMGTDFKIIIDDDNKTRCQIGAKRAFEEANRLNLIFSDYVMESEISRLSKSSFKNSFFEVSQELYDLIKFANLLSIETKGAFDISVGPLSRLWRIARFRGEIPSRGSIALCLDRVGFKNVHFHPKNQKIKLVKEGMLLDAWLSGQRVCGG